jgi:hypothetical protein
LSRRASRLAPKSATVARVAERAGVAPAHAVLAWSLQRGVGVIPRSANAAHTAENYRTLVAAPATAADATTDGVWPRLRALLDEASLAEIDALDGRADEHAECAAWAAAGECDNNPAYMRSSCRLSCHGR